MSRRKRANAATRLIVTERMLENVLDIEHYSTRRWGRKVAEKYVDEIATALDRIRANPDLLRRDPEFSSVLWTFRVRKHLLILTKIDETLYAMTLIHTSMDIAARLAELQPTLLAEAESLHAAARAVKPPT